MNKIITLSILMGIIIMISAVASMIALTGETEEIETECRMINGQTLKDVICEETIYTNEFVQRNHVMLAVWGIFGMVVGFIVFGGGIVCALDAK